MPRRLSALALPLALATALVLAGCGSDSGDSALHGISVSGSLGKAPTVDWNGRLDVDKSETTVVTKGDGDEVKSGDKVVANVWIGNGYTQQEAYSTYASGGSEQTITADDQLSPAFKDAIIGQTIGSRVAVTAPAADAFGQNGNPQMKIGNKDSILIVIDLMKMYEAPKPVDVPASKMPKLETKNGDPVGFDFKGLPKPKPTDDLQRTVLKEGSGTTVTQDMTVTADYLGEVYNAETPFDESYTEQPVPFALSQVVPGWTYGLSGLKVGSRVLLAIPPELGYGSQAQNGIPANSTLYFVVDIEKASTASPSAQ